MRARGAFRPLDVERRATLARGVTPPPDSPSCAQPLNRRTFVLGSAAAAAWVFSSGPDRLRAATPAAPYPFTLGVASGDPSPSGVVLWTRVASRPLEPGGGMPAAPVALWWEVAEDEAFSAIVRSGNTVASPQWGHTVHVEVEGLRPERWYWYRFKAAGHISPTGRTRTLPPAGATPERLRFA